MDSLDDTLRRIDEALAEPDPYPWTDAARWNPDVAAGEVEGWAVNLDPALADWYRAWDAGDAPWVVDADTAEDERQDWA